MEVKAFCTVETAALRRALALPGDRVRLDYAPESNLGVPLLMVDDTLVFARAGGDDDYGRQSFTVSVERSRLRDLLPADAETVTLAVNAGALTVNGQAVDPQPEAPPAPASKPPTQAPVTQALRSAPPSVESARVGRFIAHLLMLSAKHYGQPKLTALSPMGDTFTVHLSDVRAVDVSMTYAATAFVDRVTAPVYRERRHVSAALSMAEGNLRKSQITNLWYQQKGLSK